MKLTQRSATIILLCLQLVAIIAGWLVLQLEDRDPNARLALLGSLPFFILLVIAYMRGLNWVIYINLIVSSLLVAGPINDPTQDRTFATVVFVPPAMALIMAGPRWIALTGALSLVPLVIRSGGQGPYAYIDMLICYVLVVVCMIVTRVIADQAQQQAETERRRAETEWLRAESQANRNLSQAEELALRNAEQQKLLDLVNELETPVIPLAQGMLLAPIIGTLDEQRIDRVIDRLLSEVHAGRAKRLVLDIAGVSVDGAAVQRLGTLVRAIRMLGCEVIVSGISANAAAALVDQGIEWDNILIVRSPQEALERYTALKVA